MKPNFFATSFALVLLPLALVPSMAMTMGDLVSMLRARTEPGRRTILFSILHRCNARITFEHLLNAFVEYIHNTPHLHGRGAIRWHDDYHIADGTRQDTPIRHCFANANACALAGSERLFR